MGKTHNVLSLCVLSCTVYIGTLPLEGSDRDSRGRWVAESTEFDETALFTWEWDTPVQ